MFKRGQVVEIVRVDPGDDPRWIGFRAEVADLYLPEVVKFIDQIPHTKLVPLSDRPDSRFPEIAPYQEFFWPTKDLQAVVVSENA